MEASDGVREDRGVSMVRKKNSVKSRLAAALATKQQHKRTKSMICAEEMMSSYGRKQHEMYSGKQRSQRIQ